MNEPALAPKSMQEQITYAVLGGLLAIAMLYGSAYFQASVAARDPLLVGKRLVYDPDAPSRTRSTPGSERTRDRIANERAD